MSFSVFTPEEQQLRTIQSAKLTRAFKDEVFAWEKADQEKRAEAPIEKARADLARRKAQDKINRDTANYNAGVVDPEEAKAKARADAQAEEAGLTDFQRYSQKNNYDLDNQTKAWTEANKFRMKEADQSNVAQKDRLVAQLDTQKYTQKAGIDQTNKLRTDDNQRAIDGFKLNF